MEEIWKDVVVYEGLYHVSNMGRVKSLDRSVRGKCEGVSEIKGKILLSDTDRGYRRSMLCNDGIKKRKRSHALVLEAFIGPCPEDMEACHNNGTRNDNRLENLRWDTHSNNCLDRRKHGTHLDTRGEKHPLVKLKELEVIEIRRLLATGKVQQCILAKMFKVSRANINDIHLHRTWKHI
jgi:hypothetical protein